MGTNDRIRGPQSMCRGRSVGIGSESVALRRAVGAWLAVGLIMLLTVSAFAQTREMRGHGSERGRAQQVRSSQSELVWLDGVLAHDRGGAWMLTNGTPLKTLPGTRWRDEDTGREVSPSTGRMVRLMGQWRRGVFQVRQATLISQQRVMERQRQVSAQEPAAELKPSGEPQ